MEQYSNDVWCHEIFCLTLIICFWMKKCFIVKIKKERKKIIIKKISFSLIFILGLLNFFFSLLTSYLSLVSIEITSPSPKVNLLRLLLIFCGSFKESSKLHRVLLAMNEFIHERLAVIGVSIRLEQTFPGIIERMQTYRVHFFTFNSNKILPKKCKLTKIEKKKIKNFNASL